MASVVLSPVWDEGPKWELPHPGPLIPKQKKLARKMKKTDFRKAVILPDMQIGYYHTDDGLISTHDERAIDLAIQVIREVRPSHVILVGDNLDLPEFGRYRLSPAFARTTQATIDYATILMYHIRQAAPDAEIIWMAGNHEERLPNFILDNASPAFGLKQGVHPALIAPESRYPVLSVPNLCHLDLSGVTYLPGYPANNYWLNDRLRIIHGDRVKSRGSTAHVYLSEEKESVIYGHIHRREYASRSFNTYAGEREIMAASPGTLAKVDGAVPSTKGSIDLDGRPLTIVEDWQQGIAIVDFEVGRDHWFNYESIPFVRYRCKAEGQFFEG